MRALGFVVLVGLVAVLMVARSHGTNWTALAVLGVALITGVLTMLRSASGATLLTPSSVVLTTVFSRKSVPWDQVTRIEVLGRRGRYGRYWRIARIHRTDARPLPLPGLVEAGAGLSKAEFQEQVRTLLNYWQQATGRTEEVLFTP
jgi:hypothetical protein